jgi:hypothetical protein
MEGIIAEFEDVDPPFAAQSAGRGSGSGGEEAMGSSMGQVFQQSERDEPGYCREKRDEIENHGLSVRAVPLRVWTSEGVTRSKRVCVVYDPDEVLAKVESKPADSAQDRQGEVADEATAVP